MWSSLPGSGVLVARNNLILMVLHERQGLTRWELPAGLCENGESLECTAAREAFEETGVSVTIGALLCTVIIEVLAQEYRAINAYYRADSVEDVQPVVGHDEPIVAAAFVDPAALHPPDIHPVDRRILRRWWRNPDRAAFTMIVRI